MLVLCAGTMEPHWNRDLTGTLDKHLLSIWCVPGTVTGTEDNRVELGVASFGPFHSPV